ncbi:MAG: sulfotransferase domain-containing protein [Cyanobacteria bacterium P01_D01_bin.36]
MTQTRLPNLVIAGVVKGGTTSLYSYLSEHPDICASSVKETCYFSMYRYGQLDSRYRGADDPFEQFRQYFCSCDQQKYVMEATPGYFEGGASVANAIKQTLGDETKALIVLRNPVDRLMSFWKYKKSMLEIDADLTLAEYLDLCESMPHEERIKQENDRYWGIEGGYYANYLQDWIDVFGESVNVLFFDDLKQDSKAFLEETCNWLEIDDTFVNSLDFDIQNKSISYKSAGLQKLALFINTKAEKFWRANQGIKNVLRNFYYAFNGQPHQGGVDQQTIDRIQSIYRPYNDNLKRQLRSHGYTHLPAWLQEN